MSETVDVGIDFGTTNSVVAVWRDGKVEILSNQNGSQITPSVVAFNRYGELLVGEDAKNQLKVEPGDGKTGPKRNIAESLIWSPVSFSDRTFSMPDLAGLILADLRRTAADFLGEEPEAAVITIPAAFGEIEKAALVRAAKAVGFTQATLVQEPVAAGLAYGWTGEDEKPFLVYDIGGGTFDLSLMQVIEGQLLVRSHLGVHALGGRDIDANILDHLLLDRLTTPVAAAELAERREVLLGLCEEAKIRLSRTESATVPIQGRVRDENGLPIEDVVTITRSDIAPFVSAVVDETIPVVQRLLDEAQMTAESLRAIVLVGGPSRTPLLRDRIAELFPTHIETRIDPLTVVAHGAALYAAGTKRDLGQPARPVRDGEVRLRLEYEPIASQAEVHVGVGVDDATLRDSSRIMFKRTDGAWESGWIDVLDGVGMGMVTLTSDSQSTFVLAMTRSDGSAVTGIEPSTFTISRGVVAAAPPISEPIGVLVEHMSGESLEFDTMANRGDPTPLVRRNTYRTTRALTTGEEASGLEINFRQGSHIKAFRNRVLGTVSIRGSDLERNLPSGSEVQITLRIDSRTAPVASVFIPVLGQTWENKLDSPSSDSNSSDELRLRLEAEQTRIQEMQASGIASTELESMVDRGHLLVVAAEAGDADSLARASQLVSQLEFDADKLEQKNASTVIESQLESRAELTQSLVDEFGSESQRARLDLLQNQLELTAGSSDFQQSQILSDSFMRLAAEVWWAQPAAWVSRLKHLEQDGEFTDPESANALLEVGRKAVLEDDLDLIQHVILQLHDLLVDSEFDTMMRQFGGLRRK